MGIIACVIIGSLAGWLIETQTNLSRIGLVLNITIGVLGAAFGWIIFGLVGALPTSLFGAIFLAAGSAAVLLVTIGLMDSLTTAPMDRT